MATYGFGIVDSADADSNDQAYVRRVRPLAAREAADWKTGRGPAGRVMVIVFPDQDAVDGWYADAN